MHVLDNMVEMDCRHTLCPKRKSLFEITNDRYTGKLSPIDADRSLVLVSPATDIEDQPHPAPSITTCVQARPCDS